MKVIHLSDLHVGRSDNGDATSYIAKKIAETHPGPEKPLVIITGDVADDGVRSQFEEARASLRPLLDAGFRILSCPGNHDHGWNGVVATSRGLALYHRHFVGKDVDYPAIERIGDLVTIGLNSMAAEVDGLDGLGAEGELGGRQLKELDIELLKLDAERLTNPQLRVVLYLHHHPWYYNDFLVLKDHEGMKAVIGRPDGPSRVDVLMFGHRHVGRELTDKEKKIRVPVIVASHKSTDLRKSDTGMAVYRYSVIDTITRTATWVDC